MRMSYIPIGVENSHQITRQTDSSFVFLFQRAVLLGLKEAGHLNEMQYRQTEATLLQQCRDSIRANTESLNND